MNTMGKILVILNFLFALVVGGFLVVDFAARTDWKRAYEALEKDARMARPGAEAWSKTATSTENLYKQAKLEAEKAKQEALDAIASAKVTENTLNVQIADLQDKLKGSDASNQLSLKEQERLKVETKQLLKTVADREGTILKLEDGVKDYRTKAVAADNQAKILERRNDQLLVQLQELQAELRKPETEVRDPLLAANPNQPNPPAVKVTGAVEKVDSADKSLVVITLGTDNGVNKNNTLEVFRTSPEAKYVGMVRILEAYTHKSVGRLMPNSLGIRPEVRAGDSVASTLK